MESSTIVQFAYIVQTRSFGYIAGMGLLVYDYLLTLQQESRYVWGTRWTPGRLLFYAVRYLALIDQILLLWQNGAMQASQSACHVSLYWIMASSSIGVSSANIVIGLRTWAIWGRKRNVGVLIFIAWATLNGIGGYYAIVAFLSGPVEIDPPGLGLSCSGIAAPAVAAALVKVYSILASYQGIIFIATLARGMYYLRDKPSALAVTVYRDAFIASVSLFATGAAMAVLASNDSLYYYPLYNIDRILCAVLPARIILNIRESVKSLDSWDVTTDSTPPAASTDTARTDVASSDWSA